MMIYRIKYLALYFIFLAYSALSQVEETRYMAPMALNYDHFFSHYRHMFHLVKNKGKSEAQIAEAASEWGKRIVQIVTPIVGGAVIGGPIGGGVAAGVLIASSSYQFYRFYQAKKAHLPMARIIEYAQVHSAYPNLEDEEIIRKIIGKDAKDSYIRARNQFNHFFQKISAKYPGQFTRDYVMSTLVEMEVSGELLTFPDENSVIEMFQTDIIGIKLSKKIDFQNNAYLIFNLAKSLVPITTPNFLDICLEIDKNFSKYSHQLILSKIKSLSEKEKKKIIDKYSKIDPDQKENDMLYQHYLAEFIDEISQKSHPSVKLHAQILIDKKDTKNIQFFKGKGLFRESILAQVHEQFEAYMSPNHPACLSDNPQELASWKSYKRKQNIADIAKYYEAHPTNKPSYVDDVLLGEDDE
jgi:hypothetical protein